jgi:hypothetical protein
MFEQIKSENYTNICFLLPELLGYRPLYTVTGDIISVGTALLYNWKNNQCPNYHPVLGYVDEQIYYISRI